MLTTKQNHCNESIAKQISNNPALATLGEKSLFDGDSPATGTPRGSVAPMGGTKLRLTLGAGGNGVATNGTTSGAASGTE
jgi:hypothetical protein